MAKGLSAADVRELLEDLVEGDLIDGTGKVATMAAEDLWLTGAALKMISNRMERDAKALMMPRYRGTEGKQAQGRLVVEWQKPGVPTESVITDKVREHFPSSSHPQLWKPGQTREGLKISIAAKQVRGKTRRKKAATKETAE